jgi:hypothetical protein
MEHERRAEQVMEFIWDYLKTHEALPMRQEVATGLKMSRDDLTHLIAYLIAEGRIQHSLLPVDYVSWWKEQQQKDQTWQNKPVFRTKKPERRDSALLGANAI